MEKHYSIKVNIPCGFALTRLFYVQTDEYLQESLRLYNKLDSWGSDNYAYDWDNKAPALHVLLAQLFPSEMMQYSVNAQRYC